MNFANDEEIQPNYSIFVGSNDEYSIASNKLERRQMDFRFVEEKRPILKKNFNLSFFIRTELNRFLKLFLSLLYVAFNHLIRFGFPLTSLLFTSLKIWKNSQYYTIEQIIIILSASLGMMTGFRLCLLQSLFRYRERWKTILLAVIVNYFIWSHFHGSEFFDFPSNSSDPIYVLNFCEFYTVLLMNLLTLVLWGVIILLLIVYFTWRSVSRYIKDRRDRKILGNLNCLKLKELRRNYFASAAKFILKESDGVECCICCLKIAEESLVTSLPSCGHLFHHQCVIGWLEVNPVCPYCRSNVVTALREDETLFEEDNFGG
jgi:hypothetical protein